MDANIGKFLMLIGGVIVGAGALIWALGRFLHLGHLPGDIRIQRGNGTFYFPLASAILLSLVLSLLLNLYLRWRGPK